MQTTDFVITSLIEISFLLLTWFLYSLFRIRGLKKKLNATPNQPVEVAKPVEVPTFDTFLQQALLATQSKLDERQEANEDAELDDFNLGGKSADPLFLRVSFLETEIRALEEGGEDADVYWSLQEEGLATILEQFKPPQVLQPIVEDEEDVSVEEDIQDILDEDVEIVAVDGEAEDSEEPEPEATETVEAEEIVDENAVDDEPSDSEQNDVLLELEAAQSRIEELRAYRKLFFDLAGNMQEVADANSSLRVQLESAKAQVSETAELDTVNENYEKEYSRINEILNHVGEEDIDPAMLKSIQDLLKLNTKEPKEKVVFVNETEHHLRKEVKNLRSFMDTQKATIEQLREVLSKPGEAGVAENTEEGASSNDAVNEAASEVLKQLEVLQRVLDESESCIVVLEQDNQRRQEQLEELLLTVDGLSAKASDIETLQARIQELETQLSSDSEDGEAASEMDPDMLLELERLKQENDRLQKEISQTSSAIDSVQSGGGEILQAQEQMKGLRDQLKQAEEEIAKLTDERIELGRQLADLQSEASSLGQNDKVRISEMAQEIDSLKRQLEKAQEMVVDASPDQFEVIQLRESFEDKSQQYDKLKREFLQMEELLVAHSSESV